VIVAGYGELLGRPQLSVISAEPDHELDRIAERMAVGTAPAVRIGGPAELALWFEQLLAARDGARTIAPKTLDLLGHSTASTSQLRLGDWVIDITSPAVAMWFRALAANKVLPRLGIHAVRLLACKTAGTDAGRATICGLSDILGIEVYGTNHLLHEVHYDGQGFREDWKFLLVGASELRRAARGPVVTPVAERGPRTLELDALPAYPLGPRAADLPRRVAAAGAARQILQLVRRSAGALTPSRLPTPICELALPSATPDAYHVAHVLLDGMFLRFFPDGAATPGVMYPVDDPPRLLQIIDELAGLDISH
jgi:hypothetical protein